MKELDLIWGAEEIAKELQTSTNRVRRLASENKLPFVQRLGGQYCAERSKLRAFFLGDSTQGQAA